MKIPAVIANPVRELARGTPCARIIEADPVASHGAFSNGVNYPQRRKKPKEPAYTNATIKRETGCLLVELLFSIDYTHGTY